MWGKKKAKSLHDSEDFCRDLLKKFDKFETKSSADALNEDRMWTWILDICNFVTGIQATLLILKMTVRIFEII